MRRLVVILVFLIANQVMLLAQDQKSLVSANEAYQKGDFKEAIDAYEAILTDGYHSPALYYNLGNSYFRSDQIGKSILNFERALLLAPNDEDILHNIRVANQRVPDQPESVSSFFLQKWWHNARQRFSATVWAIIGLFVLWIGAGGLTGWILGKNRKTRMIGFIAGTTLLIASILPFALSLSRVSYEKNTGYAIVMSKTTDLQSAPDEDSQTSLQLHEGLKVQLLDRIGNWHKIRLADGEVGWVEEESLEKI